MTPSPKTQALEALIGAHATALKLLTSSAARCLRRQAASLGAKRQAPGTSALLA